MNTRIAGGLLLASLCVAGCDRSAPPASVPIAAEADDSVASETQPAHAAGILQWREERVERLKAPNGWLSLVGLHWLEPGTHTLGSAADNDIQLAVGPAHVGRIRLDQGKVTLMPDPDSGILLDDQAVSTDVALLPDSSESPSSVSFAGEQAGFTVIERSGRLGLRVKSADAPSRTGFRGIDYFDIDPSWRFDARFEPHPPGKTIKIASVINTLDDMVNPGVVVFEKDGQEYRLEAVDEGDGQLFLIFADRTNAKQTYGAGRFLYADPAVDGRTEVDFNRAYNPPCAFNEYSTCPLPPPENRLDLAITAGEKRYAGAH